MDKDQGLCSGINNDVVRLSSMLLLVKCYDKKMVKSPFNCVIFPLTQPQVARQQQQKKVSLRCNKKKCDDYFLEVIYYVEIYKFKI